MNTIGFDNQKYLLTQSEQIRNRIDLFGGKLYLEFGGKLLTIIMLQEFFRVLSLTAKSECYSS